MTETMSPFKVGEIVTLKSGGPRMTVEFVRDDGVIDCLWFLADLTHRESFHPEMLRSTND
jgi:uncharacterized protein YodC (DUF2158 family)